jgi:nucleotide-binding universal stress UspA family protein
MYRTILVPLDGSSRSDAAIPVAGRLAIASEGVVHLLVVHRWMEAWEPVLDPRKTLEQMDAEIRERKAVYVRARATTLTTRTKRPVRAEVRDGIPAPRIVEYASSQHCDLIVMTSHGRGGLSRYFLGSVTDRVLREATPPVLVLRSEPDRSDLASAPPFRHALVALDGSSSSEAALGAAVELAHSHGVGRLTLFMAVEAAHVFLTPSSPVIGRAPASSTGAFLRSAEQYLARLARGVPGAEVEIACVARAADDPVPAILEAITDLSADLVVVGTRGRSGVVRMVLGSVADKVVRAAHVPALVVGPRSDVTTIARELEEPSGTAHPAQPTAAASGSSA